MDVTKYIAYQINRQFPAIYQEDGPELVDFVRTYYNFLEKDITGYYVTGYTHDPQTSDKTYFSTRYNTYGEALNRLQSLQTNTDYKDLKITNVNPQTTFHNRRMFEYGDIDNTLESMLGFYKNKYLDGLPFDNTDVRFVVKHILDFYRRKGSKEGLELFFRLFYGENVSVYYPSENILKPSASIWKSSQYVELYPQNVEILRNAKRLAVYGSISGASAVIDRVVYTIAGNTFYPIVYLSNVKGNFTAFDNLINNNISLGIVRGSLESVAISNTNLRLGTSNNNVGDIVNITSATGYTALGRVSEVSGDISGEISFVINDGGFGYTIPNTNVVLSEQTIFINDPSIEFTPLEVIRQPSNGARGSVVGQRDVSSDTIAVGLMLLSSNTFTMGATITTESRPENISAVLQFAGPKNTSASADIGDELGNPQTISVIIDIIGDFLNVPLNSSNYSDVPPALSRMTGNAPFGNPPITINTKLADAFVPQVLTIGSITELKNVNPGSDYVNDVFVLAKDSVISRFNLSNQVINFNPLTGSGIEVGNIIVQNDPDVDATNLDIRGVVKRREGDFVEVMQLSFKGFDTGNSIFVEGTTNPIEIFSVERDYQTLPLGLNASIDGFVVSAVGKIKKVEVFDSGFGFVDGTTVLMTNETKVQNARMNLEAAINNPISTPQQIEQLQGILDFWKAQTVARGVGKALAQGKSAGVWESKTSHLNSKHVLQDSFFYQDFSYQVTSILNPPTYASTMNDLAHVAGTKAFYKFGLDEEINIQINMESEVSLYTLNNVILSTEDPILIVTEDDQQINSTVLQRTTMKV
jgi:hypothetical protein